MDQQHNWLSSQPKNFGLFIIVITKHRESSRTFLSKGLVRETKKRAADNVLMLKDIIEEFN